MTTRLTFPDWNPLLAHDVSQLQEISGIVVPTKHRIVPRQPDGSLAPTPVVVSIDISEIDFE